MKKAALITVHGMGSTPPDYNAELVSYLQHELGAGFGRLHVGSVYYQGILEPNERRVWQKVSRKVRWDDLRKFLLFGFADAAGFEAGKEHPRSVYVQSQIAIAKELYKAFSESGPRANLVIIAQSLGCQVLSCYFWDAMKARNGELVKNGIWSEIDAYWTEISGQVTPPSADALAYLQGAELRLLITTGCNIPIFVAAHAMQEVKPIRPNNAFAWFNYYDQDDILGWPLENLSDEYGQVVKDIEVNAGSGVLGWITSSWNPLSHVQYWRDDEVLDPLVDALKTFID